MVSCKPATTKQYIYFFFLLTTATPSPSTNSIIHNFLTLIEYPPFAFWLSFCHPSSHDIPLPSSSIFFFSGSSTMDTNRIQTSSFRLDQQWCMLAPPEVSETLYISAIWRPASPAMVEVLTEIKEGARAWVYRSPSSKVKVACDFSRCRRRT